VSLAWPGIRNMGGDLAEQDEDAVQAVLDEFGDAVAHYLAQRGLPRHASPIFKPFSMVLIRDREKMLASFTAAVGMSSIDWFDRLDQALTTDGYVDFVRNRLAGEVSSVVVLPLPQSPQRRAMIDSAAQVHVRVVEDEHVLGQLGDLTGIAHLVPYLRTFMSDHPVYERNVFIMMRFSDAPAVEQIHASIKSALAEYGLRGIRADDRDYTGELWSNVEVYLTGCKYGIAVFEDVADTNFNPNVGLELGYLIGRRKRTLILKDRNLPSLHADVLHRLYSAFDMQDINGSIRREVGRWVGVDLGLR
jgi:hypothetical protein